jgi:hypothetical protein
MGIKIGRAKPLVSPLETLLDERRLVSRIVRYWRELGLRGSFPSKRQVDPWLVADDWASCALVAIQGERETPTFITVGEDLLAAPGERLDARAIDACASDTVLGVALAKLTTVLSKRAPLTIGGAATHLGKPVLYRSILLPLAEDGNRIDSVLIAANYRRIKAGSNGEG